MYLTYSAVAVAYRLDLSKQDFTFFLELTFGKMR